MPMRSGHPPESVHAPKGALRDEKLNGTGGLPSDPADRWAGGNDVGDVVLNNDLMNQSVHFVRYSNGEVFLQSEITHLKSHLCTSVNWMRQFGLRLLSKPIINEFFFAFLIGSHVLSMR
jgi:hypothetical protein